MLLESASMPLCKKKSWLISRTIFYTTVYGVTSVNFQSFLDTAFQQNQLYL